jgi:hypothetical protein
LHLCYEIEHIMERHKKLIIWTLITNFFIVIAGGHGIATIGLMEGFIFGSFFNHNISKPSNEILFLLLSSAITLTGQITLIISIFCKPSLFIRSRLIGTLALIVGYVFLLAQFWSESTIGISLFTGIPFIILAILLFFKSFETSERHESETA